MEREKGISILFFIGSCFFMWILTGQIIQSQLTKDKLIKVKGIINESIDVTKYSSTGKHKSKELRIFLKDNNDYYRFMDVYKYDRFEDSIKSGDIAEIYIRPKWLVLLGMGHRNDIFQMSINGKTIFDISQTKNNTNGIIILSIIVIPMFFFLGRWLRKKDREKESMPLYHR